MNPGKPKASAAPLLILGIVIGGICVIFLLGMACVAFLWLDAPSAEAPAVSTAAGLDAGLAEAIRANVATKTWESDQTDELYQGQEANDWMLGDEGPDVAVFLPITTWINSDADSLDTIVINENTGFRFRIDAKRGDWGIRCTVSQVVDE